MAIEFRCSQCNQLLRVPETSAGKNARCPKCQALMQVPSAAGFGAAPPPPPPPGPTGAGGVPSFGAPEPPPPPAGGNDPFSFLGGGTAGSGSGTGAGGGFPPTPPPPKPSFSDSSSGGAPTFGGPPSFGSPAAPSTNPYASPAGAAYAFQPTMGPTPGKRPGLPWETKGQSFGTWMETAKMCMTQPTYAFSVMHQYGGLGSGMMYCGIGLALGVAGQMLWYLPFLIVMAVVAGNQGGGDVAAMVGMQVVMQFVSGAMTIVLGATVILLIWAAIGHVCLMIVGGARQGFETTFRIIGYAQGSTAWLNVIPLVGGLVAFVWLIVLLIIGYARGHEIDTGKAALAVFLPLIACCVAVGGLFALIMALGAASNM